MRKTSWARLAEVAPRGARILVVDDDPDIRKALSRLLTREGHTVQTAGSAEEADQWLKTRRYELCLLDIELPRMSGVEFLSWVQARDPEMAVIMLTGLDSPELALECMDHGARTFLVKPIEAAFFLRAVRDAVAVRALLVAYNQSEGRGNPAQ